MKHKHADVIIAWANGEKIQCKLPDGSWRDSPRPLWDEYVEYRVKPPEPKPDYCQYIRIDAADKSAHTIRRLLNEKADLLEVNKNLIDEIVELGVEKAELKEDLLDLRTQVDYRCADVQKLEATNRKLLDALIDCVMSLKGYRMEINDDQPCDAERKGERAIAEAEEKIV